MWITSEGAIYGGDCQPGDRAATDAEIAAHAARIRRAAILAELTALDAASARPLRAVVYAQGQKVEPDAADVAMIAELEPQAVALRAELAALGA